jgi:hypothetical protein
VLIFAAIFRLQLIKVAINALLDTEAAQLVDLQGVSFNTQRLRLQGLKLNVNNAATQLSINEFQLAYIIADRRLKNISIDSVEVVDLATNKQPIDTPVSLNLKTLIEALLTIPLQSMDVKKIDYIALGQPFEFHWQRDSTNKQNWRISNTKHSVQLSIEKQDNDAISGLFSLRPHQQLPLDIEVLLKPENGGYRFIATSQHSVESLISIISDYIAVPNLLSATKGKLNLQLESLIPESISTNTPLTAKITAAPLSLTVPSPMEANNLYRLQSPLITPIQVQLNAINDHLFTVLVDRLQVSIVSAKNNQQLTSGVSKLACHWRQKLSCSADFSLQIEAGKLVIKDYVVKNLKAQLQGRAVLESNDARLEVEAGAAVQATLDGESLDVSRFRASTETPLSINYVIDNKRVDMAVERIAMELSGVLQGETTLSGKIALEDLNLHYRNENLTTQLIVSGNELQLSIPGQWLPLLAVNSTVSLDDSILSIKGQLGSQRDKPLVNLDAEYQLLKGSGTASVLVGELEFDNSAQQPLSSWFSSWPFNWDLYSGQLSMHADLIWNSDGDKLILTGSSKQTLNNLAGVYGDVVFTGLSVQHDLQINGRDNIASLSPAGLDIALIDIGLPITDIQATVAIDSLQQQLEVVGLQAQLLGGEVSNKRFIYQANADSYLELQMKGIQVEKIVSLAAYDDILATGSIDGVLPISFTDKGISIDTGKFEAELPGGIIRYSSSNVIDNSAMQLVTEALQNYHYESMISDVTYSPKGDLELSMQLKGQNPTMNEGQKINLNLNISDNIPSLLKSLQGSRVITDILEKQIQ